MTTLFKQYFREDKLFYFEYLTILVIGLCLPMVGNWLPAHETIQGLVPLVGGLLFIVATVMMCIQFFGYLFHDFESDEGTLYMLLPVTAKQYILSRYLNMGLALVFYFVVILLPFAMVPSEISGSIQVGMVGFGEGIQGINLMNMNMVGVITIVATQLILFITIYGFVYLAISLLNVGEFVGIVLGIISSIALYHVIHFAAVIGGLATASLGGSAWAVSFVLIRAVAAVGLFFAASYILEKRLDI